MRLNLSLLSYSLWLVKKNCISLGDATKRDHHDHDAMMESIHVEEALTNFSVVINNE
jgi:hypothetical protein